MLEYELVQAPVAATIIEQCIRDKKPIPEKFANPPDTNMSSLLYYRAFKQLNTCRNYEYGYIPFNAIVLYCDQFEIQGEQRELMFFIVYELDQWFLHFEQQRQSKKGGKHGKGGKKFK